MSFVIAAYSITLAAVSGYSLFLLRRRAALLAQKDAHTRAQEPGNDA